MNDCGPSLQAIVSVGARRGERAVTIFSVASALQRAILMWMQGRLVRAWIAGLGGYALCACGATDIDAPGTEFGPTASPGPNVAQTSWYPEGPYGSEVGDTIADYSFEGYVPTSTDGLATQAEYETYSLDDMRRSDSDYAALILGESWCGTCQVTAREVGERGPEIVDGGGLVVEVLLSGDRDTLEAWVRSNDLKTTTVLAQDAEMGADLGGREWALIVDLETMKIVWRQYGVTVSLVESAIAELERLRD